MLDRKPEEYAADYDDYCRDVNIDPNNQNSITQYLNEYARWHVMFKGIGDLQPKLMELENILKEKEKYPLEESKRLVESHLDDYSAEKEYDVTYIDNNGENKEIKFKPTKNTNIAGIQKELGKKQKDFFKLKDIKECKLTESWNLDLLKRGQKAVQDKLDEIGGNLTMDDIRIKTDNKGDMHISTRKNDKEICVITQNDLRKYMKEEKEVGDRKLTISEKLLLEIIQSVNSEYTLDNVMCQTTPQGNVHITTRDGKDICTVGREEFTISGDDTILIDELRDNGYWYEDLDNIEEEVLIEREDEGLLDEKYRKDCEQELKAQVKEIVKDYEDVAWGVTSYLAMSCWISTSSDKIRDELSYLVSKIKSDKFKFLKFTDKMNYRKGSHKSYVNIIFEFNKPKEIITEGTDLSVNDNTVIVNKNQYGYNTIAIIIDDTNKRFQLVTGQSLPTGKYKKASKKAIRDKAEDLKAKGYEEVKGKFSLAERKTENKKITESMSKEDIMACYISDITNYAYTYTQEEAQKEIDFVLNDLRNDKDLDDKDKAMVIRFVKSTLLDRNIRFEEIKSSTDDIMNGKAFSVKDEEILAYIQDRLVDELGRDWRSKSLIDIEDITYNAVDQYADEHGEEDINAGAYYKEIRKLCEGKVTTARGEFEHDELKAIETEMKDAFKDYWAGNISGADLEAVKSKLGRYLTQGQISNCQYDASREVEKVTEDKKEETPEDILNRAIDEEQDAIDTYDELLDSIEDEDLEDVVKEIQKDEEDHKEILNHYSETGEVITDEDLEEKDTLDEEVLEESDISMQEPVIEYVITFDDMEEEIFDNKVEADDRFEELKASGDIDRVDQYYVKVWVWEHGGYVEDDVEVFYTKSELNEGIYDIPEEVKQDSIEKGLYTEGATNGMTFGEFKTRLNELYHNVLPNSACTVQTGALGGDTFFVTFYLAADSKECPNGIAGNDLFHIGFHIMENSDRYGEGSKLEDSSVLPENLVLDVNSAFITTTPDNKYMAYGSEKLPFRKTKGTPEKILQTLEKYASKAKEVTGRLLDEGRIPEDRVDFVTNKIK